MEGVKEKEQKLMYDLDFSFIEKMAERMQLNRHKYEVGNWMKPIPIEDLKQALFRHTIEIMKGNYDDEQIQGHLMAVAANSMMLYYQLNNHNKK